MKQFMTICERLKRHLNYDMQELASMELLNLFGRVMTYIQVNYHGIILIINTEVNTDNL